MKSTVMTIKRLECHLREDCRVGTSQPEEETAWRNLTNVKAEEPGLFSVIPSDRAGVHGHRQE